MEGSDGRKKSSKVVTLDQLREKRAARISANEDDSLALGSLANENEAVSSTLEGLPGSDSQRFDYNPNEDHLNDSEYLLGVSQQKNQLNQEAVDALTVALQEYLDTEVNYDEEYLPTTDGSELGLKTRPSKAHEIVEPGFHHIGTPEELLRKLEAVGYICPPFIASQISLLFQTEINSVRSVMLEGPSGCGKSFLGKSLAKITGADFFVLQCYTGMNLQNLIETPSSLGMVKAMTGDSSLSAEETMNLGIISKAFIASQEKPVILLVDEIDKVEPGIDTFFLGPIQDCKIYPESREPIVAVQENLVIIFTKNMERPLNDALLRRVQPIEMEYMDANLERKILSEHCAPQLVSNLVKVANVMRYADEAYPFERAPAPEELLKTGKYVMNLLKWNITDFSFIGKNIWYMLSKSERDRQVLELLLRSHPDFFDPLVPDGRKATRNQIFARLGRTILNKLVEDPDSKRRGKAYKPEKIGLTELGSPEELADKLGEVGYQCLPFNATQICLLMNSPSDKVRGLLLEGPSGCGKSFMAKCLAKITGAELMCLSCYKDMNTQWLIEYPSEFAISQAKAGSKKLRKEDLMQLGVLTRAFLKSQTQPTILLIDELDKSEAHLDTFFLGPLQDGRIWLESRPPVDCVIDNLLVIFTKNMNRTLDQALLRRLHPIAMTYLDSTLERRILSKHCAPQLVANLVAIADRMRDSNGSYQFKRPPAPEELLTAGHYITRLIDWGETDFAFVGRNVWNIISKSEHDRAILDHMLRYHPDFEDPLCLDAKNAPTSEIQARLGRWVLRGIVDDPEQERRERAWREVDYN